MLLINIKEISFSNFKVYSEDILVTHDVEDGRFSSVEFAVISEETLWSQLEKGSQKQIEVEVGQVVAFRLVGSTYALSTDFGVTGNGLVEDEVEEVDESLLLLVRELKRANQALNTL